MTAKMNSTKKIHSSDTAQPSATFSIKFSLLMALLISVVFPFILMVPLLGLHFVGVDLKGLGLNLEIFGYVVLVCQIVGLTISSILIARNVKARGMNWSDLGLRSFRVFQALRYIIGYFLLLIGALVIMAIIVSIVGVDVADRADGESGPSKLYKALGGFWVTFAVSVVIAPVVEEVTFRGMLFPALKKRFGLAGGVLLSSLVFTLVHLNPAQMMSVLPLGIYLAIMRHRTNSIYPGIILHALWNFAVLMIVDVAI